MGVGLVGGYHTSATEIATCDHLHHDHTVKALVKL